MTFHGRRLVLAALFSIVAIGAHGNDARSIREDVAASVLAHYTSAADSLKFQAVRFLLDNAEGHGYAIYDLQDSSGNVIPFSALDYATFEELEAAFNSLEAKHGTLDFARREVITDSTALTPEFLIRHVEWAFRAWRERPWARGLSFDQFCEYVLPYRGSEEPLEAWREPLFIRYDSLIYQMKDTTDPVEAATLINRDLMTWFRFDPRYYYHPTDQGYAEMTTSRLGRCEDMTNLTIYAMRANGLAVTSDYTPYWANTGNNHAWNSIVTPDGAVIPFMGAEAQPREYRLANKLAKVYRKTFSLQKNNLAFQPRRQEDVPRYLAGKSYLDVTADYVPVSDVTVKIEENITDSIDVAYLCVFNSGEWRPVHWGRIAGDSAAFTDMGGDVAYLPGVYVNKKIIPVGAPFLLLDDFQIQPLPVDTSSLIELRLTATTGATQETSSESIEKLRLSAGTEYELFFWKEGWQRTGSAVAGNEPLIFTAVPSGGLYWLAAKESDREERIFTYENGEQIWW